MSYPFGTIPIVFESGVISFDEAGVLHVFLSHSKKAPHPLQTHPDGEDGHVPTDVSMGEVFGDAVDGAVFAGMLETDEKPEGLELVISGYKSVKLEASGDLTVLVEGVGAPPDWFFPGKVHRFDGPDGPPRLWSGSAPVPKRKPKAKPRPTPTPSPGASSETRAASGGCLAVVLAVMALGAGVALLG